MKMKQRRMTDPTTWAADPTRMIQDLTRPGGGERASSTNGMIFNVPIAAVVSPPAETAGGDTVTTPAKSPPTNNGKQPDTFSSSESVPVVHCEQCGDAFSPRRPHGRFCSSYCRRLAWLGRNPEKAAELAERDRQRLREHIIGCGGKWREKVAY